MSAGLPVIFGKQERRRIRLRLRLIEIQFQIAAGSVPVVRRVGFPQNQRGGFVFQVWAQLVKELLNGQQVIVFIQQDDAALGIGGSFGKKIAGDIFAVLGHRFVKFKVPIGQGFAVLVDFVDTAFRHVYQIVFQRHVRVDIAALQIEKVQRVVGVVREGIVIIFQNPTQLLILGSPIDCNHARGKVDGQGSLVMNTAQIGDKLAVNEDPYVVVSRELIYNRLLRLAVINISTVLLHETGGHVDAKVVIDRAMVRLHV